MMFFTINIFLLVCNKDSLITDTRKQTQIKSHLMAIKKQPFSLWSSCNVLPALDRLDPGTAFVHAVSAEWQSVPQASTNVSISPHQLSLSANE